MELHQLRELCLRFPGTTEDVKWEEHLCFSVGQKMYCITGFENPPVLSIKASDEDFETLIARPGIIPAPYLARYKWVRITADAGLSTQELEYYLYQSYLLIGQKLPAKLRPATMKKGT